MREKWRKIAQQKCVTQQIGEQKKGSAKIRRHRMNT
jgi:hypothetical protein